MKLPSDPVTVNGEQVADTIAVQTMRGEKVQRASSRKPGNLLDQETDGYLPQKEPCLKLLTYHGQLQQPAFDGKQAVCVLKRQYIAHSKNGKESPIMHVGKKTLSALMALTLTASLAACSASTPADTTPSATPSENLVQTSSTPSVDEEGAKRTEYPLTITTYNYNKEPVEYTFAKAPERVYAYAQDNIEILLSLGLADRIVAASGMDGEIAPELADEFAKIDYDEDTGVLSKEDLLALEPDFIAAWYSTFSDKRLGDVDFWHERSVGTYMALNSGCRGGSGTYQQTVADECQDILTLGMIFDVQDRAEALVAEIQGELDNISTYLADKDRLTVAVLEDEGGTYRVYGEDTLGGNVATSGGAELAVGKHGDNGNISAEDLIAANPDAIFMVWYNGYTVNDTDYAGEQVVELITENPAFASLDAVKNGRVFAINLNNVYCSGMRTLDGVLDFAQHLYPELYQ